MGVTVIPVEEFVELVKLGNHPVFDARSESEFAHAHIPGALNIPILNDSERIVVGTVYKQNGREDAVHTGFKLVGPRFHEIITHAITAAPGKEVLLYCWRGGMRSQIMSWLLQMNGFNVITLKGGYKSFRQWVPEVISRPIRAIIIGGPTGSGKTEILDQIKKQGGQVLQLEELANHKGSAFGGLGKGGQPSNEYFENMIAMEWSSFDNSFPVWIENESRSIGSNILPEPVFNLIRTSDLIEVNVGDARRKQRIMNEYGIFPKAILAETTKKIGKRLGPQHLKHALQLLDENDLNGWLEIVLSYYDKLYAYGSSQRIKEKCYPVDLTEVDENEFAGKLMHLAAELFATEKIAIKTI